MTIVGPVADDPSWQTRLDGGLTKAAFRVDWDRKVVTCPAGKQNISWLPSTHTENGMVCLITWLRIDASLFAPAPPRWPGQMGRPRLNGKRLPAFKAVLADPNTV